MSNKNILMKETDLRNIRKIIEDNIQLTASDIARRLGKPKSTIFNLLNNFLADVVSYNKEENINTFPLRRTR